MIIPLVVINKIDRDGARPDWVLEQTFDLFDSLGATDEQLDFPVVYASALYGYTSLDSANREGDMVPLLETIVSHVAPPAVDRHGPLQMQISSLDYDPYVGVLGIGRIRRGTIEANSGISLVSRDGSTRKARILDLYGFHGLERRKIEQAEAGDIVVFSGIERLNISDTICAKDHADGLPPLAVDEPTISMTFQVNTPPIRRPSALGRCSRPPACTRPARVRAGSHASSRAPARAPRPS